MKGYTYIEDEIFVVGNESEASPEMKGPREEEERDGHAHHSHRREDRKPHHRRNRHRRVLERENGVEREREWGFKGKRRER